MHLLVLLLEAKDDLGNVVTMPWAVLFVVKKLPELDMIP
jgi:hypothetical protein